jgi:AraC-like DNA-binding protein
MPASELANAHISLEDLWGLLAADLRDELLYSLTAEAQFRILEKYLLLRMANARPMNPAVQYSYAIIRQDECHESVAAIARQTNMSAKHFIQLFKDEVGLTPKKYSRLLRFQKALRIIRQSHSIDWSDVAMVCGYYDQSHFIKEFSSFSGLTPTAYRQINSFHPNHLPFV